MAKVVLSEIVAASAFLGSPRPAAAAGAGWGTRTVSRDLGGAERGRRNRTLILALVTHRPTRPRIPPIATS